MNAASYFAKNYFAPNYFAVRPAQFNANWYTYEGSGAIWVGGSADIAHSRAFHYDADGGIWIGGRAGLAFGKIYNASGGIVIDGAAETGRYRQFIYEADGAIWLGGEAEWARGWAYQGSGAIWLAGAADIEFIRGIPLPLLIRAIIIGHKSGAVGWEGLAGTITAEGLGPRAEMLGRQLAALSISAEGLRALIRSWSEISVRTTGVGPGAGIRGTGPRASLN